MERKYHKINWEKGMRLSEQVFIDADNHWDSLLNKIRKTLIAGHYGFVDSNFCLEGEFNKGKFTVRKLICRAITPAGYFIDIQADYPSAFSMNNPNREIEAAPGQELYLYVAVNPFVNIPIGEINPMEQINRYPYSDPQYEFFFTTEPNTLIENACLIAKFYKMERDVTFIPPCVSIATSKLLQEVLSEVKAKLNTLSRTLIEKRRIAGPYACLDLLLASLLPVQVEVENQLDARLPIDLFLVLKKVAQSVSTFSKVHDFFQLNPEVQSFLARDYNHHDLAGCMNEGLNTLSVICSEMSGFAMVIEEPVELPAPPPPDPKKRRDIKI